MKKIVLCLVLILFLGGVANAQNVQIFNGILVDKLHFTPGPVLKGFMMFKKGSMLMGVMPTEDGWIKESFVVIPGNTDGNEMFAAIRFVYMSLQDSRKCHNLPGADIVWNGGLKLWNERTNMIISKVAKGLGDKRQVEFNFDGLIVKGADAGDERMIGGMAGDHSKQILTIKMWISK
jgi:hypothetical protein